MKKETTLLAGLLLIFPGAAIAGHGMFSGSCVNCHTMHNSNDNATLNPDGTVMGAIAADPANSEDPVYVAQAAQTCKTCHIGRANGSTGRATDNPMAPQVSSTVNTTSGGYFVVTGLSNQHDVLDMGSAKDSKFTNVPGGVSYGAGWDGLAVPQINCGSCHNPYVGHANATNEARLGTSSSSYRMLGRGSVYVKGTGSADYETGASARNKYYATSINALCGECHTNFHATGASGQGSGIGAINAWVRHPTGVAIQAELGATYTYTGSKTIPTGWDEGNVREDVVMCISCHRPHGSQYQDLLRFSYNLNSANDTTAATGCEDCHGSK